jgi:hypothetical protein
MTWRRKHRPYEEKPAEPSDQQSFSLGGYVELVDESALDG